MKRRIVFLVVLIIFGFVLAAAATPAFAARSIRLAVIINEKPVAFDAYYINGGYYFKLRDLAYALRDTEKRFTVGWDGASNTIALVSGESYTPDKSETQVKSTANKTAAASTAKILVNGKEMIFSAYSIDGSNYLDIRNIGQVFNFYAEWDAEQKKFVIDTSKNYDNKLTAMLSETDDMGQEYLDKIIFIGDSTTYGLLAYGVLSGGKNTTQVWVPENHTFSLFNQGNILIHYPDTGENITIERAISLKKPEYIIITLGVNGVASMSEANFKRDYKALISRILDVKPDIKIMLNSIYPVARNYARLDTINNTKIALANTWVYAIAEELGLKYLGTDTALKDKEGWLYDTYQNGDGMHLSLDALKAILNYIRTHGYR